jgi:hypothetical protein
MSAAYGSIGHVDTDGGIVGGMSATIRAISELSDQLSSHAEELGGSVDLFLQSIRG